MFLSKEKLKEILARCLDQYLPAAATSIDDHRYLSDVVGHALTQANLQPWARPWLELFIDACVTDHKEHRSAVGDLARSLPDVARAFRVLFVCPISDRSLADALLVDFLNSGVFGTRWCFDLAMTTHSLEDPDR
jgi:hypothetical protein